MRVNVLLFAVLRERAGTRSIGIELESGATVARAVEELLKQRPELKNAVGRIAYAINMNKVDGSAELHDGDELALLPPVSGG